ncbi:MAG: tRNA uridine-5-carboxymethylaminomethyl(34) synthesis enzyme MnmG, partial [bacterium]|nr:tRNA uridine-5-carboxymethylaminomethyl(34) synthesis enzyme MnmG [bacterium]
MNASHPVIVIGGGHAGAEAAWAAASLGVPTLLITLDAAAIGRMSCNPAIGGIGKGQIVREIDALGGLMGLAADAAGIQFRMLNRRKGPAVWAPRAQCDRGLYASAVQRLLEATPNLKIIEGRVDAIDTRPRGGEVLAVSGVRLADGRVFSCQSLVVTTGTFLRGLMHTGTDQTPGGRVGEGACRALSEALEGLGLELGRLKTGTPPRLARDSVACDRLEAQPADESPAPFSFLTGAITQPQVDCWITYTNESVH